MATSVDPRIGSVLVGYRIEALLGRGGMSVVYRAEDLALQRKVALKLLAPELAAEEGFRERFQRESRLAASLDHPGVVPVYEAGEVQGQLYIAMRYVEGSDLGAVLREEGPLPAERAIALCAQVADALDEAHERGLVHRDVKPSNILIDARGRCYLADFGLTKRSDEQTDLTGAGRLLGSSDYIAPEAVQGATVDRRADVYSLGCLLYHCLAGKPPYRRDTELATLWAHVHDQPPRLERLPALDPVIAKALAKQPDSRYPTATALVDAARAALPRLEQPPPARRTVALAVALVALGLAVFLAVALTRSGDTGPSSEPTPTPTTAAIQRIDPETNELVATIAVPVSEFALAAGGGAVWAANRERNEIYKIDPDLNRVVATIGGSGNPAELAYGAGSLWVLNPTDGIVTRVAPETSEVTDTVALPTGSWPQGGGFRASPHGVWISWLTGAANAVRIDPRSTAVSEAQMGGPTGGYIVDFAIAATRLWAHSELDLLRTDTRGDGLAEVEVVPLGEPSCCGQMAADATGVWQAFVDSDRLVHFGVDSLRVDREVAVGDTPWGVALGHGAVWVTNQGDGTLSRIDPRSAEVVATIQIGPSPWDVVVDDDSVWVAVHPPSDAVSP